MYSGSYTESNKTLFSKDLKQILEVCGEYLLLRLGF